MRLPILSAVICFSLTAFSEDKTGLARLDALVGEWRGTSRGQPGEGTVHRVCERVLNGRFIECRSTSTYPPGEKKPRGEVHVDRSFFSYDKGTKKLRLRQFHGEGFVNTYVAEGEALVFVTNDIENIPPGWRARETYDLSGDTWTERFDLAAPGKEFELYSASTLQRAK